MSTPRTVTKTTISNSVVSEDSDIVKHKLKATVEDLDASAPDVREEEDEDIVETKTEEQVVFDYFVAQQKQEQ